jgi:hypothetical protein
MTRRILFRALVPAALLGLSNAPQDGNTDLVRSGVMFLQQHRHNYRNGILKVDPRVFVRGSGAASDMSTGATLHDSAFLSAAQIHGTAEVVTVERANRCRTNAPPVCMQNAVSVVAAFGRPVVRGDTATIDVLLSLSHYVSPEDSAARSRLPAFRPWLNLRRAGRTAGYLIATRQGGAWVVREFKVVAQT